MLLPVADLLAAVRLVPNEVLDVVEVLRTVPDTSFDGVLLPDTTTLPDEVVWREPLYMPLPFVLPAIMWCPPCGGLKWMPW